MIKKDIAINVDGIAINGQLFVPGQLRPYPTVCLCHGIPAGNKPEPNDGGYPLLAENICQHGLNVFIFNFRGTGISGGNIDLLGWTKDLASVIDHLYFLPEVDKSHIAVLGFSGGAAVSICVAARDNRINYLAACACPAEFYRLTQADDAASWIDHFRRIGAIRDDNFPRSTKEWLDGFRFVSPVDYISQIAPRPLLLIHANDDETVSISHAHRLYDKAGEPKHLVVLDAAGHKLRRDQRVLTEFIQWFMSHLQAHKAFPPPYCLQ